MNQVGWLTSLLRQYACTMCVRGGGGLRYEPYVHTIGNLIFNGWLWRWLRMHLLETCQQYRWLCSIWPMLAIHCIFLLGIYSVATGLKFATTKNGENVRCRSFWPVWMFYQTLRPVEMFDIKLSDWFASSHEYSDRSGCSLIQSQFVVQFVTLW